MISWKVTGSGRSNFWSCGFFSSVTLRISLPPASKATSFATASLGFVVLCTATATAVTGALSLMVKLAPAMGSSTAEVSGLPSTIR